VRTEEVAQSVSDFTGLIFAFARIKHSRIDAP